MPYESDTIAQSFLPQGSEAVGKHEVMNPEMGGKDGCKIEDRYGCWSRKSW